jgi:hypothetical protein
LGIPEILLPDLQKYPKIGLITRQVQLAVGYGETSTLRRTDENGTGKNDPTAG